MKSRRRRGHSCAAVVRQAALGPRVLVACCLAVAIAAAGCRQIGDTLSVRPRALRDVPAHRLAFRLEPDVPDDVLPAGLREDAPEEPLATIRTAFETQRKDEALLRTVAAPDGLRALALYDPGGSPQTDEFRLDLYGADGTFVRNVLPADLVAVFPESVVWSPDGQWIAFAGRRSLKPQPSPAPDQSPVEPVAPPDPAVSPTPTPSVAPLIAPVPVYGTEQVYLCDRDGFNLRPLTNRDGLIYFGLSWSPDGTALAALACKTDELNQRIDENKQLAGRPRLIDRDGRERLLADELTEAVPVWSPDATKVATATESDVLIFDAAGSPPTGARLSLREPLLAASAAYDEKNLRRANTAVNASGDKKQAPPPTAQAAPSRGLPVSFNPVVRLHWVLPETLLAQTAFVRIYANSPFPIVSYKRWHLVHLSPQAAVLG